MQLTARLAGALGSNTAGAEFAAFVTSLASSTAHVAGSELNALGAANNLFTAMGRTTGADRIRVTVGFNSAVPEPATWAMMASALIGLGWHRMRRSA